MGASFRVTRLITLLVVVPGSGLGLEGGGLGTSSFITAMLLARVSLRSAWGWILTHDTPIWILDLKNDWGLLYL